MSRPGDAVEAEAERAAEAVGRTDDGAASVGNVPRSGEPGGVRASGRTMLSRQAAPAQPANEPADRVPQNATFQEFVATSYCNAHVAGGNVPVLDARGNELGRVTGRGFVDAAMEGTAVLSNGTQVTVEGFAAPPDPGAYAEAVAAAHRSYARRNRQGRPLTPRNVGLVIPGRQANSDIDPARDAVSQVMVFRVTRAPEGARGRLTPYRSVAVGAGIPLGTSFFIRELRGRHLPDGTSHDGWVTAADHGGNITGNRIDFFTGDDPGEFLGGTVHVYIPPAGR